MVGAWGAVQCSAVQWCSGAVVQWCAPRGVPSPLPLVIDGALVYGGGLHHSALCNTVYGEPQCSGAPRSAVQWCTAPAPAGVIAGNASKTVGMVETRRVSEGEGGE